MTNKQHDPARHADSWDVYWHGAGAKEAFTGGGSSHPAIGEFWDEVFGRLDGERAGLRLVDIAGGSGAVIERAARHLEGRLAELACVDLSPSAMKLLEKRFPEVRTVVADARDTGLESGRYDIATSQFGMEYAGIDAIAETLRLVADDGLVALLVHHRGGSIYRQCSASHAALAELSRADFVATAIATFETGFAACRGGDRSAYEAAARRHVPTIRATEAILQKYGRQVADGTIARLYKDIADVHRRLPHYDPDEVLGWLRRMGDEIDAYSDRMSSMCAAAIDEPGFADLCSRIENGGFRLLRADALAAPGQATALAWAVVAERA